MATVLENIYGVLGTISNQLAKSTPATTSTPTNVTASATSVQLLAANAGRKMATFFNDADKSCYLKTSATASTTSFTTKIAAAGYFELPYPISADRVDCIWDASPTGAMRITEYT